MNTHSGHTGHYSHVHRGHSYRHYCYGGDWHGWTRRCWCPRYGFYIYWCPNQRCWYRYVEGQAFLPCDKLTSEVIDGNSVDIDDD
jgi:hypothetical protein